LPLQRKSNHFTKVKSGEPFGSPLPFYQLIYFNCIVCTAREKLEKKMSGADGIAAPLLRKINL